MMHVTNGYALAHHRCRMGSGVCLMATRAPPWSKYSTAYSSLKICRVQKWQRVYSALTRHQRASLALLHQRCDEPQH